MEPEERKETVKIYFSLGEKQRLVLIARNKGISVSDYGRMVILEKLAMEEGSDA